jgi:hypothetical protein
MANAQLRLTRSMGNVKPYATKHKKLGIIGIAFSFFFFFYSHSVKAAHLVLLDFVHDEIHCFFQYSLLKIFCRPFCPGHCYNIIMLYLLAP